MRIYTLSSRNFIYSLNAAEIFNHVRANSKNGNTVCNSLPLVFPINNKTRKEKLEIRKTRFSFWKQGRLRIQNYIQLSCFYVYTAQTCLIKQRSALNGGTRIILVYMFVFIIV